MSRYQAQLEQQTQKQREEQFKELMNSWVYNFLPMHMHNSRKTYISADVTIEAMEPIIPRPDNKENSNLTPALLLNLNENIIIRVFYNFTNKISFDKFIGANLNAFGETKTIVGIKGVRDIVFSHIYTRKTKETIGSKVRATLVAFEVKKAETQLPQNLSHAKYLDVYMDPFCDASSSVSNLGVSVGRVGDYYEHDNLNKREFVGISDNLVKAKFDEIEAHLKNRTDSCEGYLRKKMGL